MLTASKDSSITALASIGYRVYFTAPGTYSSAHRPRRYYFCPTGSYGESVPFSGPYTTFDEAHVAAFNLASVATYVRGDAYALNQ